MTYFVLLRAIFINSTDNVVTNMKSELIIYNTQDGKASVALFATDGDVWMNQQQLA